MRPHPANAPWLLPLLGCVLAAAGCRLVDSLAVVDTGVDTSAAVTTPPKPAARTILLEVLFVRCDEHDRSLGEEIWTFVDERALGDSACRALNANGLRAGVVTGHLPPQIAERFTAAVDDATTSADFTGIDAALARRRLRLLPGRRSELVLAAQLENVVLLEQHGGDVAGATFRDAAAQFAIEARPAADGRVRIEAVPEIRHGPVEKSWVGEDGMFRLETGQRRHRLDRLAIDVTLPPGGTLVVGCAGDASATAGDVLLREHGRGARGTMRLLAIRPLAQGVDPLFAAAEPEDEAAESTVAPGR